MVWRGDNTCGKKSFKLNSTKRTFLKLVSKSLTLAATAVARAVCCHLPESGSSGRVRDTSKADPRCIWALAAAAVLARNKAVSVFKVCAGAADGGQAAL